MTPFIEDLKDLYCDGITVSFGGEEHTIYGALFAFLADTLAAHLVGGFKESMSFPTDMPVMHDNLTTNERMLGGK